MAPLHLYQTFTVVFGPFILMKGNNIMLQTAFQQIKGKRQRAMIAFLLALFTLAILSPFGAPAYAQDTTPRDTRTWTDPNSGATFTFSTPEIFNSCSTRGDRIYTIGLQPGWRLDGTVTVRQPNGSQTFTVIDVDQSVDLDLLVPYPPVSQWQNNISNREIHVDLSIAVLNENNTPVGWIGDEPTAPGILGPRGQDWDVFCSTPQTPAITIKKYTNGADADNPTAAGVPLITAGAPVTWTYRLTNSGPVDIPLAEIAVTDNIPGVNPLFAAVISGDLKGDGNQLLQPNEVWEYTATGTAVDLANPPGGQGLVLNANACQQGNVNAPGRNAYTNIGTVQIPNMSAADPSSYCNPLPPTGTLSSICVNNTRTWTVNVSQSGAYVAQFLVGGNVQSSANLNLTANTPATFTYSGDPTTLSSVRVTFNGAVVASESGPFASCTPPPPTGTLSSICVNNTRTWTVNVSQSGAYVAQFLVGGNVQSSANLNLTANTPATFTYSGDPTTLSSVRVTFNGAVVASESGPFASCTPPPPTGTLSSICVNNTRTWTVNVSQSGAYVAQFLVGGNVQSSANLNLTANTPATFTYSGDPTTLSSVRVTFNGAVVASESGPFASCTPPPPTGTLSSICVNNTRTWTVNVSQSGAYVAQFLVGGNVQSSANLNLTANTPATFTYSGDPTTLSSVRVTFNGAVVASESGPFASCTPPPPTGTLSSICVNNTRTWTVNVSQSGAYVAQFLVGGNVQSSANLNLTANTPATFTYSGDPTTLSSVRVTFNGAVVASESGPFASCTPPPPTGTLSSICVNNTRTWTVNVSQSGAYVAQFLVGGNVQSSANLNLTANTPATFTYSGDPTTLSSVRVTFNGAVVASESGPFASCTPPPPTGTLSSICVNNTRTWTVNVSQSGAYVAQFLVGGNVQSSANLNLTANTPATFTYSGDPTTLSSVRVTFNGAVVASESGPFASCTEPPSVTLTPRCTNEGLAWQVTANRTGQYVVQVISNGNVIEQSTLNLTANQPQDVVFTANSYTPNTVRVLYQGVQVSQQTGPEPCVDGLSAAMAPRCERIGTVWTVLVNRSGSYMAQLVDGTSVIESRNLTLTDGLDVDFQFENDSTAPRFVRLVFQGAEYARQNGLNESCVPTSLPPTEEPNLPVLDKFIYLPTVNR
jgi:hypothetical protein